MYYIYSEMKYCKETSMEEHWKQVREEGTAHGDGMPCRFREEHDKDYLCGYLPPYQDKACIRCLVAWVDRLVHKGHDPTGIIGMGLTGDEV